MLNLNKCTKNKPKPKPTLIFKNCSSVWVCEYHCAQLSYTAQNSSDPSHPPDNHHSSDDVYWRGRAAVIMIRCSCDIRPLPGELSNVWLAQWVCQGRDVGGPAQGVFHAPAAADDECVQARHDSSHQQCTVTTASPWCAPAVSQRCDCITPRTC